MIAELEFLLGQQDNWGRALFFVLGHVGPTTANRIRSRYLSFDVSWVDETGRQEEHFTYDAFGAILKNRITPGQKNKQHGLTLVDRHTRGPA